MNERLQKWLENHLVRSEYTEFGWQECHRYEFDEHELEKFAELIVRECIQVVDGMADPEEDSDRYVWALHNASEKIKQHFGVEESKG